MFEVIGNVFDVAVDGVPLIFVVLGLVQWIKMAGVPTKYLQFISMGIGLLFGGGYQVANLGLPTTFAVGFSMVVFSIGYGLVASGIYDVAGDMLDKALTLLLSVPAAPAKSSTNSTPRLPK